MKNVYQNVILQLNNVRKAGSKIAGLWESDLKVHKVALFFTYGERPCFSVLELLREKRNWSASPLYVWFTVITYNVYVYQNVLVVIFSSFIFV